MSLKLITRPSALAVTLAEAKAHLRVDVADDDGLITALITTATEYAENMTGRAIMPQTFDLVVDSFPEFLELTRAPVASVTSVAYVDLDGVTQTMNPSQYRVDLSDGFGPARIVPAYGVTWPVPRDQFDAVTVRYVAGYADAASVPESIKSWIKLQVGSMYENRLAATDRPVFDLKFADRLLDQFKVWAV